MSSLFIHYETQPIVVNRLNKGNQSITMIPPADSLLKYDNPVLVILQIQAQPQSGPTTACHDWTCVTSTQTQDPLSRCQQTEEILNAILPPRECMETNQLWVQQVSSTLCTRMDVVKQARETGICPVLRELYSQCFGKEREEGKMRCMDGSNIGKVCWIQILNPGQFPRGPRLERQVNEQKAKTEAIEKRETEKRKVKAPSHNPCAVLPTPMGIVAPNKAGFS
uniref:Axonemal dynein light intermediate polypeptide 1 n=1 Tax=Oncorhynchus kisutch TaxID=8019 RepID=A0A8C7FM23_ONCKI